MIAHLSDPHIGADWGPGEPLAALAAAVRAVGALGVIPDAVLVSGDLANTAADAEYDEVRRLLAPLDAPVCVLAGNHDRRSALRRHFELPGRDDEPVQYAREFAGLRLVVLDTLHPGDDRGELDAARLAWLDSHLAEAPETPTLLAMHHQPFATGVLAWDRLGLPGSDLDALAEVIRRHPQVGRVTCGHLHRAIVSQLAGRAVLAVPSTYVQSRLDPVADRLELCDDPAGFAVHMLIDGHLSSHLLPVN